jgi:hypothetical protein
MKIKSKAPPIPEIHETANGRRYVLINKKRVWLASNISERDLIKWIIKKLKPKRRRRVVGAQKASTVKPVAGVSSVSSVSSGDIERQKEKLTKLNENIIKLQAENKAKLANAPLALMPPAPKKQVKVKVKLLNGADQEYDIDEDLENIYKDVQSSHQRDIDLQKQEIQQAKAESDLIKKDIDKQKKEIQELKEQEEKAHNKVDLLLKQGQLTKSNMVQRTQQSIIKSKKDLETKLTNLTNEKIDKDNDINELRKKLKNANVKAAAIDKPTAIKLAKKNKIIDERKEKEYFMKNILKGEIKQIQDDEAYLNDLLKEDPIDAPIDAPIVAPVLAGNGKTDDDGMNTNDINAIMGKYPEYKGCIGSDQLNLILKQVKPHTRICWVMNTSKSTAKDGGMHWICCLIDARPNGAHSIEYYNSLGNRGVEKVPKNFLSKIKPILKKLQTNTYMKLKFNNVADQNNYSSNCGQFCCKFLIDRLNNKSFAHASGYDKQGEKMIEKFKLTNPDFKFVNAFNK